MRFLKNHFITALILLSVALFFSCASAGNMDSRDSKKRISSGEEIPASGDKLPPPPVRAGEAPKYEFSGEKLQIEAENMYYDGFQLVGDAVASKSYALKLLNDSSWAIAEVNFPAGSYEAVANVLAPSANHTRFNLYVNRDSYLLYGSEPPIGKYELTTRSPASFTLDVPTTVTVKIQKNDIKNAANNGHDGMTIDYISFKKIK